MRLAAAEALCTPEVVAQCAGVAEELVSAACDVHQDGYVRAAAAEALLCARFPLSLGTQWTGITGAKVQILTLPAMRTLPALSRYSVYWHYWCKSANTDASCYARASRSL